MNLALGSGAPIGIEPGSLVLGQAVRIRLQGVRVCDSALPLRAPAPAPVAHPDPTRLTALLALGDSSGADLLAGYLLARCAPDA